MDVVKGCARALLVGGLLGALGQLFLVILVLIFGADSPIVGPGTLILMGVFALITFPLGIYQKITEFGGFGAMLPFSGLAAAIADGYDTTKHETGSVGKAIKAGIMVFLTVIGTGLIVAVIVSIITFFVGGINLAAGLVLPEFGTALSFVFAFLVCGILSAIFHAIMMIFKLKPPVVLIIGFSIGALLVPFGLLDPLVGLGGAGMSITVMAAGGASCGGLIGLLAGDAVPLVTVLSVFIGLAVIGLIAGAITNSRRPKEDN